MFSKIKEWIFGKVILQKVIGKFVKHAIGTFAGLAGVQQFMSDAGVTIDWMQLESWLMVAAGGAFGAIWNFVEHRIKK